MIKPQDQFPLLDRYSKVFAITKDTIFAYDGDIYTNNELPNHLLIHENVHLRQQAEIGVNKWVDLFLTNVNFRIHQEVEAYLAQLASVKDRNDRHRLRIICARNLSSDLYGNIMSHSDAMRMLK